MVPPVVTFPTPHQGSVLGRVVAESHLGQIFIAIQRWIVLGQAVAETKAQLAAERALNNKNVNCKHGLLEICCAICKEQKDGGLVDARGTANRYVIRHEITKDKVGYRPIPLTSEAEITLRHIFNQKPEPRFVDELELHGMCEVEQEQWERCRREGVPDGLAHPAKNWDADLKMYVQENWKPREGSHSSLWKQSLEWWFEQNVTALEEARNFQRSTKLYLTFCVEFEFPKAVDEDAMEKAAERLIKTVPREHLTRLTAPPKPKRHYVRHSANEITFVRQQDLKLATNV